MRFIVSDPAGTKLAIRIVAEVELLPGQFRVVMDKLLQVSIHRRERGAQGFVAPHERFQGAAQPFNVQGPVQAECDGDIVGAKLVDHLVDDPEPPLSMRNRVTFRRLPGSKEVLIPQLLQSLQIAGLGSLLEFFDRGHSRLRMSISSAVAGLMLSRSASAGEGSRWRDDASRGAIAIGATMIWLTLPFSAE